MDNVDDLPIADLYGIDDGWGVVGVGLECSTCQKLTMFVSSEEGEIVTCGRCGQKHYVDKDYEY